jgi:hypothetical protein
MQGRPRTRLAFARQQRSDRHWPSAVDTASNTEPSSRRLSTLTSRDRSTLKSPHLSGVWDVTVFTKNRDRLLNQDIARSFFRRVVERAQGMMSDEHSSVDGTPTEAWARASGSVFDSCIDIQIDKSHVAHDRLLRMWLCDVLTPITQRNPRHCEPEPVVPLRIKLDRCSFDNRNLQR